MPHAMGLWWLLVLAFPPVTTQLSLRSDGGRTDYVTTTHGTYTIVYRAPSCEAAGYAAITSIEDCETAQIYLNDPQWGFPLQSWGGQYYKKWAGQHNYGPSGCRVWGNNDVSRAMFVYYNSRDAADGAADGQAGPICYSSNPNAAATGDPHLQNIHGERFDLMKPGKYVLINIPRGKGADSAMLRVQADAVRMGKNCGDLYFQHLNVTGSWAEAKQAGGYHYSVSQSEATSSGWEEFGKVALKIVIAHTDRGVQYLNVYAKHLGQSAFAVGGLLGEDEHEEASTPPETCVKRASLAKGAGAALQTAPIGSVAEATSE